MKNKKRFNFICNKVWIAGLVFMLFFLCSASVYAYFSTRAVVWTDNGRQAASIGMKIDLLFDRIDSGKVTAGTPLNNGATYDPNAPWGSKSNPYIISNIRHLKNLSVLQGIGFFKDNFLDKWQLPYFLVCTSEGKPVTIDGSGMIIAPIGNDTYPFMGALGGAFATPQEGQEVFQTQVGDKSSETSAIYNLSVKTDTDCIDVGLFGMIGTNDALQAVYDGQACTVENLLLYDVQIAVQETTFLQELGELFTSHTFLRNLVETGTAAQVPHENHHIGILAGHVANANVNYISVYYSNETTPAIHLKHKGTTYNNETPNYLSTSGIIGFMDNMNPTINEAGTIVGNSGHSSSNISIDNSVGTGGGLLSGTGRGYVTASELYDMYKGNATGDLRLMDAVDSEGNSLVSQYKRKRLFWGTADTNLYYFYDGVFTFALSSQNTQTAPNQDKIEATWQNEAGESIAADQFFVGENSDDKWKKNTTKGNNSVIAYVKEINSQAELDQAISVGKQIYIGYDEGSDVYLMSLTNSDTGSSNWFDNFGDDKYTTDAFKRSWLTNQEEISSIQETLLYARANGEQIEGMLPTDKNGNVNNDIIENIDSYRLINLGSDTTVEELNNLRNQYPIDIIKSPNSLYQFKNNGNFLSLLRQRFWFQDSYSIWAGTEKPSDTPGLFGRQYYWQNQASVIENIDTSNDTATFQIRFVYSDGSNNSATRYVQYDINNNLFKGTSNQNATGTNLKFYTVEGTSNLNFGRITYDPVDSSNHAGYEADQVVLWPEESYPGAGGRNEGTNPRATYSLRKLQGSLTEQEMAGDTAGIPYLTKAAGWKNRSGEALQYIDLHKKFTMQESAKWGATITILNGNYSIGDGTIVAPVGTLGVEANIPLGTIAFRINKTAPADKPNKIKVIVAVPICEYYNGENPDEAFYNNGLNYFGLWHVTANGEALLSSFNADNAMEKFELPRSNPYNPSSKAGESDYVLIKNGEETTPTSRCYLNGDRVLVAYEFSVTDEGVYLLGATNGPMEIVYFAADNTASAGRDGSLGSMLGTIDFVYDYDGKVICVNQAPTEGDTIIPTNDKNEDFHFYYSSLSLMYTDNGKILNNNYVDINDLQISVRRFIDAQTKDSTLRYGVLSDSGQSSYLQLKPYSDLADTVIRSN